MADSTQIIYCEGEPVPLPDLYNNGDYVLFSGGLTIQLEEAVILDDIDRYNLITDSENLNYGNLSLPLFAHSSCSNSIDAFSGGFGILDETPISRIDKVPFQNGDTTATEWGALQDNLVATAAASNGVHGLWAGGTVFPADAPITTVQRITLSFGGTATDFNDLNEAVYGLSSGANDYYAVFIGGTKLGGLYFQEEISIAFDSAIRNRAWGDLSIAKSYMAGASDNVMVITAGGAESEDVYTDVIEQQNIDLGWTFALWGNLIQERGYLAGSGNRTDAIFGGGTTTSGFLSSIEKIGYLNGLFASQYSSLSKERNWCSSTSGGGGANNPIVYPIEYVNNSGSEGLAVGGQFESVLNHIYINSRSNATRWGELTDNSSQNKTALSTEDKAIFGVNGGFLEEVQYGSESNSVNFATLIYDLESNGSANNDTIGLTVAGGDRTGISYVTELNEIIQVDMVSAAIVYGFGDVGPLTMDGLTSVSDGTLCYNIAGYIDDLEGNGTNVITTVPFATGGTVTNFGNTSINRMYFAGASNNFVAMFGGGWDETWDIISSREAFEMANETTSSFVPNLVNRREGHFGLGNGYLCLLGGGENPDSEHYLNNEESIEEFSYYNYSSVEYFGDLLDPQFSTNDGIDGASNFVYSQKEIVPPGQSTPDPCYKGCFFGGEFAGDYSLKINIKTAAMSTMWNSLLEDSCFTARATSDGVYAHIGTGTFWQCYGGSCIHQIDIAEETQDVFWGNITEDRYANSACSDGINSYWAGGRWIESTVDSLSFADGTSVVDWGTLSDEHEWGTAASNNIIAVIGPCDQNYSPGRSRFEQIEFASGGFSTYFGDTSIGWWDCYSMSDLSTVIIWGGYGIDLVTGDWTEYADRMESFAFASGGVSSFFGNVGNGGREYSGSVDDNTTGILGAGYAGQYYTQMDYITIATESNDTHWADIWSGADRQHDYACTSGGCSVASDVPTANCEDLVMFDLYSYIGFHGITFDSNMDDIKLYEAKDRDIDLYFNNIIITDRLDLSIDNLRTFHIDNCIFNTGSTIYFKHITDLEIKDLSINTDTIYHDEDFDVMNIEKSRVFILESTINITEQNDNTLNFNSVNFIDTFIKDLNVISVVK